MAKVALGWGGEEADTRHMGQGGMGLFPREVYTNQQIKSKIDLVVNVQKMGGFTLNIRTSGFLKKSKFETLELQGSCLESVSGG